MKYDIYQSTRGSIDGKVAIALSWWWQQATLLFSHCFVVNCEVGRSWFFHDFDFHKIIFTITVVDDATMNEMILFRRGGMKKTKFLPTVPTRKLCKARLSIFPADF